MTDKQLSLCCLIKKKKDQDCKEYQSVQTSDWQINGKAEENVHWSLLQFHKDT